MVDQSTTGSAASEEPAGTWRMALVQMNGAPKDGGMIDDPLLHPGVGCLSRISSWLALLALGGLARYAAIVKLYNTVKYAT